MKVLLRNPKRELDVRGPLRVGALLEHLGMRSESVLVICDETLVPADTVLADGASVEVRPVISGGAT